MLTLVFAVVRVHSTLLCGDPAVTLHPPCPVQDGTGQRQDRGLWRMSGMSETGVLGSDRGIVQSLILLISVLLGWCVSAWVNTLWNCHKPAKNSEKELDAQRLPRPRSRDILSQALAGCRQLEERCTGQGAVSWVQGPSSRAETIWAVPRRWWDESCNGTRHAVGYILCPVLQRLLQEAHASGAGRAIPGTPVPGRSRCREPRHPHSQAAGAAQRSDARTAGWKPALLPRSPILSAISAHLGRNLPPEGDPIAPQTRGSSPLRPAGKPPPSHPGTGGHAGPAPGRSRNLLSRGCRGAVPVRGVLLEGRRARGAERRTPGGSGVAFGQSSFWFLLFSRPFDCQ